MAQPVQPVRLWPYQYSMKYLQELPFQTRISKNKYINLTTYKPTESPKLARVRPHVSVVVVEQIY